MYVFVRLPARQKKEVIKNGINMDYTLKHLETPLNPDQIGITFA